MAKCKLDIMPFIFLVNFMKNDVRERNIYLLLEAVTYMATTETATCIITIKNVTHIFASEIFTNISVAESSNCIVATKTVISITITKRSTNIIAVEPQNLRNCNRRWHLYNCYRNCQLHSFSRNCHLQNWLQTLSLAETATEIILVIIKKLSE